MVYRPYRRRGINPIWVLIAVNFVVFIAAQVQVNNSYIIIERFGLSPTMIPQEWWTFFTYMFVHQAIWHILFNMIALYFFGTMVMSLIGETPFLTTYFVGGIAGGLMYYILSFVFHNIAFVIGASGAIYALGGLLLVMRPNVRVMLFPLPVPMPLWVAILIGLVLVTFFPNVAWQAHLGGLLYGAALGYYYRQKELRRY